ncbi:cell division cycle 7-related protein kinase-like [Palaemon carinicauda]|uniref:cell division cycle 7-related protein kinase-like n=1 Tax=Palaemon carinicauda TaxID=392227 RepID=UPI0035B63C96
MDSPDVAAQDATLRRDEDAIAVLQDAVPQLDSLFVISHTIGNGTFSSVYFARTKHSTTINGRRHFAVKHIIPTSHPSRIYMELKCLKLMGGRDNVMGVTMCLREMNHIVIVMPYFPHDSFTDYVGSLSPFELQDYLKNLLIALRRVHSFKIIHRDVKPANFLYNRKHQRYSLVDFGLAQEVGSLGNIREYTSGRGGAYNVLSPTNVDTPHVATNKTAKRKLPAYCKDDAANEKNKRSRALSPPTSASGGVLSSTTNRVNTSLRRSPRKSCSLSVSPKKENLITPRKGSSGSVATQDSPSKHTRNMENMGKAGSLKDGEKGLKAHSQILQMRQETVRGLRRSPRKSMPVAAGLPLEGLAKHLQEATALNATAKTAGTRGANLKLDKTVDGDSSCTSRNIPQRLQGVTGYSPRVSGIMDATSLNKERSNFAKRNRVLQEVHTKSGSVLQSVSCHCYGSARVCTVCLGRNNQHAPRAGTPGFRAPEVLLRHPDQGTAVDMWSVGVILLCLLSGRYPFFKAADDLSTLAEISTLLGSYVIRKVASKFGKLFTCSEERRPLDLVKVCELLRNNTLFRGGARPSDAGEKDVCSGCKQSIVCICLVNFDSSWILSGHTSPFMSHDFNSAKAEHQRTPYDLLFKGDEGQFAVMLKMSENENCLSPSVNVSISSGAAQVPESPAQTWSPSVAQESSQGKQEVLYPPSVYHLLYRLLDPDPETRITAAEALEHPFLKASFY